MGRTVGGGYARAYNKLLGVVYLQVTVISFMFLGDSTTEA